MDAAESDFSPKFQGQCLDCQLTVGGLTSLPEPVHLAIVSPYLTVYPGYPLTRAQRLSGSALELLSPFFLKLSEICVFLQ